MKIMKAVKLFTNFLLNIPLPSTLNLLLGIQLWTQSKKNIEKLYKNSKFNLPLDPPNYRVYLPANINHSRS